jgi:glycosyltransferase involved in cell wall biosynthesis
LPVRSQPARLAASPRSDGTVDVSLVVPTYNEGIWLNKTVESIRDSDNDLRYEIVVVDDGCSDGSVDAIEPGDDLRVVTTGGPQLGLIIAKNIGAKAARGKYLCFVDSHMLVHHHWLDYLRETCDGYPEGALVSGNLPDVARFQTPTQLDSHQYGYMIRNCLLGTGWHFYGSARTNEPYLEPLTPGGLMFTRKAHFARIGGFAPDLRKWGSEDVQISLQNYYMGGENVVDPRVVIYHYYKNGQTNKRTFSVSTVQSGFNSLYVAATYFPAEYYQRVRNAFITRKEGPALAVEIESLERREELKKNRSDFVRGFGDWTTKFKIELSKFFADAEQRSLAGGQGAETA